VETGSCEKTGLDYKMERFPDFMNRENVLDADQYGGASLLDRAGSSIDQAWLAITNFRRIAQSSPGIILSNHVQKIRIAFKNLGQVAHHRAHPAHELQILVDADI